MRFFISYAHSDGSLQESKLVEQFFKDLRSEVMSKTGDSSDVCGYLDSYNLKTGDLWKSDLSTAIRTSRTFICLMNARYFRREYCGKEWQLFENRCKAFKDKEGVQPNLIFPVVWDLPEEGQFPSFATDLQFGMSLDGVSDLDRPNVEDFNRKGMRFVIKRRETSHINAYELCIETLAKEIIKSAAKFVLPEVLDINLPTLDQIPAKFPVKLGKPILAVGTQEQTAAIQAKFAVIAAKKSEIQGVLDSQPEAYGGGPQEWIPFHPSSQRRFYHIAQTQANEHDLMCEWLKVDENLVKEVKEAENNNGLVIMVVDPTTVRLNSYSDLLRKFDEYAFRNCVVLLPDTGAMLDKDLAEKAIEQSLKNRFLTNNSHYLRKNINSVDSLELQISIAIKYLGETLAAERSPVRALRPGRFDAPPTLVSV